jgi:hypothetical protein
LTFYNTYGIMRDIMTRNNNQAPGFKKRHLVYAGAALAAVAIGSRFIPSGEAPSAAPADNGEAIPAATATANPAPAEATPSVVPSSESPSPTPSPEASTVPPMPETGNTESPNDPQKSLRELIAKRYISCDVSSLTSAGKSDGNRNYTVSVTYNRDQESAGAREKEPTDITWTNPELTPIGLDKNGKPNGMTYVSNPNESDHDETATDTFALPLEDVKKGSKAAVGVITLASGEDGDGRYITTEVTTVCDDTPVFTYNGSDWKLDATPTPLPVYGPHAQTVVS